MPKITDLTEALTVADGDFLYAVVGGNSRKVKKSTLIPSTPVSGIKLQTAITAAGQTELPYTGIPTWINRVNATFSLLSASGTNDILLQIGDGAYIVTGYTSSAQGFTGTSTGLATATAGFLIDTDGAAGQVSGNFSLIRHSGNTWLMSGTYRRSAASTGFTVGELTLSGNLDRLRLTTVGGTDTFDGGSFNVSWE